MNRLIVMMSEEINVCNNKLPIEVKKIYDSWLLKKEFKYLY